MSRVIARVTLFLLVDITDSKITMCGYRGEKMENSYKYFENKECQYYPCHQGTQNMNCMFCYCPLYSKEKCPGNYRYIEVNGKKIKECTDCIFPHEPKNYEIIMALLG